MGSRIYSVACALCNQEDETTDHRTYSARYGTMHVLLPTNIQYLAPEEK
jgi:hypothetical protein